MPASPLRRAAAAADTHAAAATAARADLAAARKAERQLRGQLSALGETLDATKQGERHAKQRCSSMMDALRRVQSEKRVCVGEQEALARRVAVQQRTVAALQGKVASLEAALVKVRVRLYLWADLRPMRNLARTLLLTQALRHVRRC